MKSYHKNPRQITKKQYADLERWLLELGDLSGIVHDLNSDEIVAGNQRGRVFDINQCKIVKVQEFDEPDKQGTVALGYVVWEGNRYGYRAVRWTERQCEQANVVANRAGGEWDWDVLANQFEIDDLLNWGFDEGELGLHGFDLDDEPPEDPGAQIDKAAELQEKWGTALGQVWELGDHRLVCGDCTDAAVVERVMGKDRVDAIITDPPYGVGYDGGTTVREKLSGDESPALYFPFLKVARWVCADHAALYLFYADGDAAVTQAVTQAGYTVRNTLIWNKNQAQFGALSAQYKQKHEPFLYCHLKGKSPQWFGPTNEVTVWDVARASTNKMHPTQKPVELFERALRNSTKGGDVVLDGFLGSGTAVAACERLGRCCRGAELEPKYVAVTLQRWHDMTGREPVLLEG